VTGLYLFGSAARDELNSDSDIDVFIDYVGDGSFTFVEWFNLHEFLKSIMQRRVDFTSRKGLHKRLRAEIERTALQGL
jgi:predicted nucleotidyltransferase